MHLRSERFRPLIQLILIALALSLGATVFAQDSGEPAVAATADGSGAILVIWAAPENTLPPGGFRVRRTAGGESVTLAEALRPGDDAEAMGRLAEADRQVIAGLRDRRGAQPLGLLIASAAADFDFARALGVAFRDPNAPNGPVTYTVEAIQGSRAAAVGTSRPVSRSDAPAVPSPPSNVTGTVTRTAVTVTADATPKAAPESTAVTYLLHRFDGKSWTRVSPRPVMPSRGTSLLFVDEKPGVVEADITYAVTSRSIFGIESARSQPVTLFVPDFEALDPPRNVTAVASPGSVRVTWEKERNPNTAGFLVLRAPNIGGPYTRLTQAPVTTREYVDTTARAGTSNYYQVVSVNRRREEGGPSLPSVVIALGAKAPAPPAELTAERKTGRILLRWQGVEGAEIQGYRIERDAGDGDWTIVNAAPSTEPRFDDRLPVGVIGEMKYRVFAIALDGQVSPPSQVLTVPLPRAHAPATPEITSVSGLDGRVRLEWRPTGERGEATHYLVLRSTSPREEGVIVSPAPIAHPAVSFTDAEVTAGLRYYYRVVAFDAAGNRSTPSEPASVHVGTPPLPALAAPQLRYETKPYPRVVARFAIPNGFAGRAVLERREPDGRWRAISAPSAAGVTQLVDTRPRSGTNAYRLVSVSSNGVAGGISAVAEVSVP